MPFIEDYGSLLAAAGVGVFGVDIVGSTAYTIPRLESGAILSLIDSGGGAPDSIHNLVTKPSYRSPSLLVMARGATYAEARDLAEAAFAASTKYNSDVNGTFYQYIRPESDMLDQKPDTVGNPRVSFNVAGKRRA